MLGFIAAVGAELATGREVSQQVAIAPGPIAGVFLLFTVASLIPILKVCHPSAFTGLPRGHEYISIDCNCLCWSYL
jgi:hypothetical protein